MPAFATAGLATRAACGDAIGSDPRVIRSGNSPSAFNVAHWLRDRRLSFEPHAVRLTRGCDSHAGNFPIADEGGDFDVIVVGAGLAGLSAAFYILRARPTARVLLLEANGFAGGNAGRDEAPPMPVPASTAGAFAAFPYTDALTAFYKELAIDWEKFHVDRPGDSYYFDETTPGVKAGYRAWHPEFLAASKAIANPPYGPKIMADFARCAAAWRQWEDLSGSPDDPPDASNPQYDDLAQMTLADYLTKTLKCDPLVAEFYTAYTTDCMGGSPFHVNAHTAISFLSSEYGSHCFAYPGGTSEIALRLVKWLTNSDGRAQRRQAVDLRLDAVALRLDDERGPSAPKVSAVYYQAGAFHRATAKAMVVATQASSARHLIDHLADAERKAAWSEFNTVPALMANVAVRTMAPFAELALGYANHFWGSRHWANFEIADWTTTNRNNPDRPSVLTFYGAMPAPPDQFAAERVKLLQTPFAAYEASLREDLARVTRGTKFDFDRDVSAIFVYRWGHSMILPTTKSIFGNTRGPDGRLDRTKAPRRIACRPLGPISFAGQHTEGAPSVECAIASGYRAANEVGPQL